MFEVADSIDRDRAGRQLACFLAALHQPSARQRAEAAIGRLSGAELPPPTTRVLRDRFITGRQLSADRVMAWHLRTALGGRDRHDSRP